MITRTHTYFHSHIRTYTYIWIYIYVYIHKHHFKRSCEWYMEGVRGSKNNVFVEFKTVVFTFFGYAGVLMKKKEEKLVVFLNLFPLFFFFRLYCDMLICTMMYCIIKLIFCFSPPSSSLSPPSSPLNTPHIPTYIHTLIRTHTHRCVMCITT